VSRHKIEPRKALRARLLRGAWNAPLSRKRRALAFYLLAIFIVFCIFFFIASIRFMIALVLAVLIGNTDLPILLEFFPLSLFFIF
jgi:hypothetical protein